MATFDDIPLEVQEHIFLHLTPQDLKKCSVVCSKWHAIINSNQIWQKVCSFDGLVGKKFLDDDWCIMQNPLKRFTYTAAFTPPCHWKSHFNRYRYVKRNWRMGHFVVTKVPFTPIHANEQYIVQQVNKTCVIWDVCGKLIEFCTIELALDGVPMDNFLWKGDYIVYSQGRLVVCLKRTQSTCKEVLKVELKQRPCNINNCVKQKTTIRLTDKFLLIQDHLSPCVLLFYDHIKNISHREIDLHKTFGNSTIFNFCNVMDDKLFLAYRIQDNPFLVKYSFSLDAWEAPIPLPHEAVDMYVSKKFLCIKLNQGTHDTSFTLFQVWDHSSNIHPMTKVTYFTASKHLPICLTENDYVIFHIREEVKIHGLSENYIKLFNVSRGLMKYAPVWDKYLVVLDDKGVSVWDWQKGKKVCTPLRDNFCSTFYASETNIVIRRDDDKFFVVSFW